MKLHAIAFVLVVIGGLNWGLVAIGSYMGSNWNVVNLLLGSWPAVENLVYLVVGLSALTLVFSHKKDCRACNPSGM
ncbi:MAG: DUF378 domain-containing protein [Candidatus Paceibacterota bacterium]|jgi:uncharacterized membrane protein YuzA (DUF378 family)